MNKKTYFYSDKCNSENSDVRIRTLIQYFFINYWLFIDFYIKDTFYFKDKPIIITKTFPFVYMF